jgi:hypothetical protein
MRQPRFIDLDGQPKRSGTNRERADDVRCSVKALASRTFVLRVGLATCLAWLAVVAPKAAWRDNADFENGAGARIIRTGAASFRMPKLRTPMLSADALYRQRIPQYRNIELELLQRRFAQRQQRGSNSKWLQRRDPLRYLFLQHQYPAAALYVDGASESVDLRGVRRHPKYL